jgi:hypothetical protein
MSGSGGGNRQDNRQRGNAAQLLEKYKSMARDAQLGGDRVQTEYYLQFADHYYRVLGESRSRFEDQRGDRDDDGDNDGDGDDDGMEMSDAEAEADERPQRRQARDRNDRPERTERAPERNGNDRPERSQRAERPERIERTERSENTEQVERSDRPERAERAERPERPERPERTSRPQRANGRPRDDQDDDHGNDSIPFDVLPPAIGADEVRIEANDVEEDAPKPRRRAVRRPRPEDGDTEIAPAA